MFPRVLALAAFGLALPASPLAAKPIAYAQGSTVMAEYGAGTMREAQAYYAPRYWWSAGGGAIAFDSDVDGAETDIGYLRLNLLAKRWNLPAAQANVFVWGGLGSARGNRFDGNEFTGLVGGQFDYETRRFYSSLRFDRYHADDFAYRVDTLQLGWAPYAHDWDRLATWFVLQGRDYGDDLHEGIEWALLLRLFKGGIWFEAGVTDDGKPQAMLMFNF